MGRWMYPTPLLAASSWHLHSRGYVVSWCYFLIHTGKQWVCVWLQDHIPKLLPLRKICSLLQWFPVAGSLLGDSLGRVAGSFSDVGKGGPHAGGSCLATCCSLGLCGPWLRKGMNTPSTYLEKTRKWPAVVPQVIPLGSPKYSHFPGAFSASGNVLSVVLKMRFLNEVLW